MAFSAVHRTRLTVWNFSCQEDLTSSRAQFLLPVAIDAAATLNQLWKDSIPDPVARDQVVRNFIRDTGIGPSLVVPVNSFTNRIFLQKSAHGSVTLRTPRGTIMLGAFHTRRNPQSALDADRGVAQSALEERTRQTGITALWNHQLSPRTSATASAGYTRIRSDSVQREDENLTLRAGLTRVFQPGLKGGIELRRQQHQSNVGSAEYRENAISAFVSLAF
jgi:uncharacterized protein (PEP-CTERM system associated)